MRLLILLPSSAPSISRGLLRAFVAICLTFNGYALTGIGQALAATTSGCADVAPVVDMTGATLANCSANGLQSAINSSSAGRVMLPANCTLTLTAPLQINRDITIDGAGGTISGNNVTRIFDVNRNNALPRGHRFTVQNVSLINGRDSGSGGGAIRSAQFGDITVVNVNFSGNVSLGTGGEDGGGAILKDEGGKLTIFNSTFQGNTATNGGAIKSLLANIQVVDSAFINNVARGGNNGGGAIFLDGLEVTSPKRGISQGGYAPDGYSVNTYGKGRFCGVLFRGNSVGALYDVNVTGLQGGGLFTHVYGTGGAPIAGTPYFTTAGYTAIEVERAIFDGNTAVGGGGGLRLGGDGAATLVPAEVKDSMFRNNRSGNHGGAIRMTETEANYTNLLLADNCANADGTVLACTSNSASGGIGGGIVAFEKKYNVDRLTVVRNRAASYGGGLDQTGPMGTALGAMNRSIVAANSTGNPYNVGNQCAGPVFTNGANSYQWPGPTNPNYDAACGAATNANPNVSSTPTLCTTTAGSSSLNAAHYVMLAATGVPSVSGVPVAGALCPTVPVPSKTAQSITVAAAPTFSWYQGSATLSATASSGLPVTLALQSGPCTLVGNVLTATRPGSCVVQATQSGDVSFDAATPQSQTVTISNGPALLNIDASGPASAYDPATDGLLLQRYLLGYRGADLMAAKSPTATRSDTDILIHLNTLMPLLDVDGDGLVRATSDGVLILRYLRGARGSALTQGAARGSTSAADIEAAIGRLMP